ncbi:chitin-binding domain-containing protein, partial [Limosilactobacillus reuteri]
NELRKTSTPVSNAFVKTQVVVDENYNFNPSYNFRYGVNDPNTGDSKFQQESLFNGVVHGSYSLAEPDGTIRKVTYTADDLNGFRATVEKLVNHEHSKTFKRIPHSSSIIKTPVPVVPVVKTVPAYQASPIYHKGLISSVLIGETQS